MEFKSITEINVKLINPQVIDTLLKAGGGEYSLELFFENRQQVSNDDVKLKILPRGRPKVLARDPLGGSIWANEKMLNPRTIDGVTRYFLRITFEDFDEFMAIRLRTLPAADIHPVFRRSGQVNDGPGVHKFYTKY